MSAPEIVLNYITDYIHREERAPTLREICNHCRIASTSQVSMIIDELVNRGDLIKTPVVSRGIRLPGDRLQYWKIRALRAEQKAIELELDKLKTPGLIKS